MNITCSLRSLFVSATMLLSVAVSTSASSTVMTFEMEGAAVFSSNPIPGISLGDPFTASLTYDSDLATTLSFGVAPPFGVVSSSITYATAGGDVSFISNDTSDAYFAALNDRTLGTNIVDEIQITFDTGTVFDTRIFFRFIDYDAIVFPIGMSTFPTNIDLTEWEFAELLLSTHRRHSVMYEVISLRSLKSLRFQNLIRWGYCQLV